MILMRLILTEHPQTNSGYSVCNIIIIKTQIYKKIGWFITEMIVLILVDVGHGDAQKYYTDKKHRQQ